MYQHTSPRITVTGSKDYTRKSIDQVLSAVRHLEASYGLQPFTIIVVEDAAAALKKIQAKLPGQEVLTPESSLAVLAIRPAITRDLINEYITDITIRKKIPRDSLNGYRKHFENTINNTDVNGKSWPERQAGIALDVLLSAARRYSMTVATLRDIDVPLLSKLMDLPSKGWNAWAAVVLNPVQETLTASSTANKTSKKEFTRL